MLLFCTNRVFHICGRMIGAWSTKWLRKNYEMVTKELRKDTKGYERIRKDTKELRKNTKGYENSFRRFSYPLSNLILSYRIIPYLTVTDPNLSYLNTTKQTPPSDGRWGHLVRSEDSEIRNARRCLRGGGGRRGRNRGRGCATRCSRCGGRSHSRRNRSRRPAGLRRGCRRRSRSRRCRRRAW